MQFDSMKAIEAAAVIARREGKRITRLRLLKLLYIAERELAKVSDRRLIRGRLVAMDHGPLHGDVYNMIKGESLATKEWSRYFTTSGRDVILTDEPDLQLLSRTELHVLNEVTERHENIDDWRLSLLTHEFPEWEANYEEKTSRPIKFDEVLAAVDRRELADDLKEADAYAAFFEKHIDS